MKLTVITVIFGVLGTISKGLETVNQRKKRDHPNHYTFDIGLNTEKSPKELRRLAIKETIKDTKKRNKNKRNYT